MPALISLTELIEDDWVRVADNQSIEGIDRPILSSERLRQQWQQLESTDFDLGIACDVTDLVEEIQRYLPRLSLVVLNFPVFSDGRAFSQAYLLRKRFAYQGDIRAVGDVIPDQLSFMRRCGFNQFQLADSELVGQALASFCGISHSYQPNFKFCAVA